MVLLFNLCYILCCFFLCLLKCVFHMLAIILSVIFLISNFTLKLSLHHMHLNPICAGGVYWVIGVSLVEIPARWRSSTCVLVWSGHRPMPSLHQCICATCLWHRMRARPGGGPDLYSAQCCPANSVDWASCCHNHQNRTSTRPPRFSRHVPQFPSFFFPPPKS